MTSSSSNTFVEEELSTKVASVHVDGGEVRLVYHSSMSVSASGKNVDKLKRVSRYMPDFANGDGFWIHKYPYEQVTEQPVESAPGETVTMTIGGKRKIEFEDKPKAKVQATRTVKSKPSQSQPMTKNMASRAFEKSFIDRVRNTILEAKDKQAKDDVEKKIVQRSAFIGASSIKSSLGVGSNRRQVELEFGVNVTNYSIVKAKTSGGDDAFEGGPRMLAQFMLREKGSSEKNPPIVQFACTADEMLTILCHPNLNQLVTQCATDKATGEQQEKVATTGKTTEYETEEEETEEDEEDEEDEDNEDEDEPKQMHDI